MPKDPQVLEAQKIVEEAGYDPGPIDGIAGKRTRGAMREFLNVQVPDKEVIVLDTFRQYWGWDKPDSISGVEFTLMPVKMLRYTGKMSTLWINADVYDSFIEGFQTWEELEDFRMTETLRTLAVQKSLKRRKPSLAATPGWSLHGHGRAFDFDITTVSSLLKFYQHMAKFGWYNIYSKLKDGKIKVVECPRKREAWHLQRTDPPGIHKNTYLKKWAGIRGGLGSLQKITYKYDKSQIINLH